VSDRPFEAAKLGSFMKRASSLERDDSQALYIQLITSRAAGKGDSHKFDILYFQNYRSESSYISPVLVSSMTTSRELK
jgi:hypothetical protein